MYDCGSRTPTSSASPPGSRICPRPKWPPNFGVARATDSDLALTTLNQIVGLGAGLALGFFTGFRRGFAFDQLARGHFGLRLFHDGRGADGNHREIQIGEERDALGQGHIADMQ